MPDKLSLYNGALTVLGERKLASLTENREPRHKLDDVFDNDLYDRMLHQGQWKFAKRTVKLSASASITPPFGHQFAFDQPDDFIRTMAVAHDEYFNVPITRYDREGAFFYADVDEIYLMYVSNDSQYGTDLSLWTPNFTEMVEHYMAWKVGPRIMGLDISEKKLAALWKGWLREAKATDAMESPAKFPPKGGWAQSRQGFRRGDIERGNRSQLIG